LIPFFAGYEVLNASFNGSTIEIGERSPHLLVKRNHEVGMPAENWLRKYGFPIVAEAAKKDQRLRTTLEMDEPVF